MDCLEFHGIAKDLLAYFISTLPEDITVGDLIGPLPMEEELCRWPVCCKHFLFYLICLDLFYFLSYFILF